MTTPAIEKSTNGIKGISIQLKSRSFEFNFYTFAFL